MNPLDAFTAFTSWLAAQMLALLDALNPVTIIMNAVIWVAAMLPEKNDDVLGYIAGFQSGLHLIGPWFAMLDYVINLQVWLAAVALVGGIESGLAVYRIWRMVRSAVT